MYNVGIRRASQETAFHSSQPRPTLTAGLAGLIRRHSAPPFMVPLTNLVHSHTEVEQQHLLPALTSRRSNGPGIPIFELSTFNVAESWPADGERTYWGCRQIYV
jgi:hypothetical protein